MIFQVKCKGRYSEQKRCLYKVEKESLFKVPWSIESRKNFSSIEFLKPAWANFRGSLVDFAKIRVHLSKVPIPYNLPFVTRLCKVSIIINRFQSPAKFSGLLH